MPTFSFSRGLLSITTHFLRISGNLSAFANSSHFEGIFGFSRTVQALRKPRLYFANRRGASAKPGHFRRHRTGENARAKPRSELDIITGLGAWLRPLVKISLREVRAIFRASNPKNRAGEATPVVSENYRLESVASPALGQSCTAGIGLRYACSQAFSAASNRRKCAGAVTPHC